MSLHDAIERGIIEPAELHALLAEGRTDIKLLDASFVLPGAADNPHQNFIKSRIKGAAFFDIEKIADHTSDIPHMLPSAGQFSAAVSKLGISNTDTVIVYGQSGMVMGPARAWWSFRVFGHHKICVLNGGLPAWLREGFPVTSSLPELPAPAVFTAEYNPALVRTLDDMRATSAAGAEHILDARPENRFSGAAPEPRPGMRAGHIPGSKNLPCMTLISPETGKLKPGAELEKLFSALSYRPGDPVVTTCGSGVTACVIALALFHLGHKNVPVYDGAWSEWGRESAQTDVATA